MKALIVKDFYVLRKSLGLYALVIVLFQLMGNATGSLISILYAALLPSAAFAYDDRSRWDELELMLPYSVRQIVLSRYCVGWISTAFFLILGSLARTALSSTLPQSYSPDLPTLLAQAALTLCFLALSMPLHFRFDAERSRVVRMFLIALVCGAIAVIYMSAGTFAVVNGHTGSLDENITVLLGMSAPGLILVAAILTAISIPLSICAHRARHQ